jgi:hypothetical protein
VLDKTQQTCGLNSLAEFFFVDACDLMVLSHVMSPPSSRESCLLNTNDWSILILQEPTVQVRDVTNIQTGDKDVRNQSEFIKLIKSYVKVIYGLTDLKVYEEEESEDGSQSLRDKATERAFLLPQMHSLIKKGMTM